MWPFTKKKQPEQAKDSENNLKLYHELADLLDIGEDRREMIDTPEKYYEENQEAYEERSIEAGDIRNIRLLGLTEEMLRMNLAKEFDFKVDLEDFTSELSELLPPELSLDYISLDEDCDITVWADVINKHWEDHDYVLAGLDIDSDSYVTLVVKKNRFLRLKETAGKLGHRIDLLQNM